MLEYGPDGREPWAHDSINAEGRNERDITQFADTRYGLLGSQSLCQDRHEHIALFIPCDSHHEIAIANILLLQQDVI